MKLPQMARMGSMPTARVVGPGKIGLRGGVNTRFGYDIPHESKLERDAILVFDFDACVESIQAQPVGIPYVDAEGVHRTYYPDLLVHFIKHRGRPIYRPRLCEMKYVRDLRAKKAELLLKMLAGARYAKEQRWDFKVITENHINPQYVLNIELLKRFRNEYRDDGIEAVLVRALKGLGETTPETLLVASSSSATWRMEAVCSMWQLVVDQVIGVDLYKPLTMHSKIWLQDWR